MRWAFSLFRRILQPGQRILFGRAEIPAGGTETARRQRRDCQSVRAVADGSLEVGQTGGGLRGRPRQRWRMGMFRHAGQSRPQNKRLFRQGEAESTGVFPDKFGVKVRKRNEKRCDRHRGSGNT